MVLIILMLPFATKWWGSNNFRGTCESATHWLSGVCLAVREKGEHPGSKAECIGWCEVAHPRMGPFARSQRWRVRGPQRDSHLSPGFPAPAHLSLTRAWNLVVFLSLSPFSHVRLTPARSHSRQEVPPFPHQAFIPPFPTNCTGRESSGVHKLLVWSSLVQAEVTLSSSLQRCRSSTGA